MPGTVKSSIIAAFFLFIFSCSEHKKSNQSTSKEPPKQTTKRDISIPLRVDGTNIFNNEWIIYKGKEGAQNFTLKIIGKNKSELNVLFERNHPNTTTKLFEGTLLKSKRRNEFTLRYKSTKKGVEFSNGEYNLKIEMNDHRYARFSWHNNQLSVLLVKEGLSEPHNMYFSNLFGSINNAKRMALDSRKSQKIREEHTNQYYQLLDDFDYALKHIRNMQGYDKAYDSYLYDAAIQLKLDSAISILESNGVAYKEYVPNATKPIIYKNFDGILIGEIKNGSGNSIFEKVLFSEKSYGMEEDRIGYSYLQGRVKNFKKIGPYVVASMHNWTDNLRLSIWQPKGDSLEMISLLDGYFGDYMSSTIIDTLITVNEEYEIFIGQTSGGDGGQIFGELWLGSWNGGKAIDILYSKQFAGNDNKYTYLKHEFLNDTILTVEEWQKKWVGRNESKDSLLLKEDINLVKLLEQNDL